MQSAWSTIRSGTPICYALIQTEIMQQTIGELVEEH